MKTYLVLETAFGFSAENYELQNVLFYNYDHLGNTRVTYNVDAVCNNSGSNTVQYDLEGAFDYFPYGKIVRQVNLPGEKYLYNGFERDIETSVQGTDLGDGLDYYKRRYFDSDIARFLQIDPLNDKFLELSAYQYAGLNPILYVDLDGMEGEGYGYKQDQYIKYQTQNGNSNDYLAGEAIKWFVDKFTQLIFSQDKKMQENGVPEDGGGGPNDAPDDTPEPKQGPDITGEDHEESGGTHGAHGQGGGQGESEENQDKSDTEVTIYYTSGKYGGGTNNSGSITKNASDTSELMQYIRNSNGGIKVDSITSKNIKK